MGFRVLNRAYHFYYGFNSHISIYTKNTWQAFLVQYYMKIQNQNIDSIKVAFEKMATKEDLLKLLNLAKPFVYGKEAVPFQLKQITWYSNPSLSKSNYFEFLIAKKSGEKRKIQSPRRGLKSIQKTLSFILQCVFEPHESAMGFTKGKSIVDNARIHENSHYVYNIDLKDFFHSIDQARFWKCLQLKPFNLKNEQIAQREFISWEEFCSEYLEPNEIIQFKVTKSGKQAKTSFGTLFMSNQINFYSEKFVCFLGKKPQKGDRMPVGFSRFMRIKNKIPTNSKNECANIIASLCFQETSVERKNEKGEWVNVKRNVLPQGAPTSPIITNIICQQLDHRLSGVAKRFGLRYSRYADDITFSSMNNVYQKDSDFLKEILRIITQQGFHIKESKTRLQKEGFRQEVTGIVVNKKVNVNQRYIKQLRMWLYYWEKYGYEKAESYFTKDYNNTNQKNNISRMINKRVDRWNVKEFRHSLGRKIPAVPNMQNIIAGKLEYLKMVRGGDNGLYLNLKKRYDSLSDMTNEPNSIIGEAITTNTRQVKITLGVYKFPKMKEKLNNSILIPLHTKLPSTIIFQNSISEIEEVYGGNIENKTKKLFFNNSNN